MNYTEMRRIIKLNLKSDAIRIVITRAIFLALKNIKI